MSQDLSEHERALLEGTGSYCGKCGFDVRARTSNRCSECGSHLAVVGTRPSRRSRWRFWLLPGLYILLVTPVVFLASRQTQRLQFYNYSGTTEHELGPSSLPQQVEGTALIDYEGSIWFGYATSTRHNVELRLKAVGEPENASELVYRSFYHLPSDRQDLSNDVLELLRELDVPEENRTQKAEAILDELLWLVDQSRDVLAEARKQLAPGTHALSMGSMLTRNDGTSSDAFSHSTALFEQNTDADTLVKVAMFGLPALVLVILLIRALVHHVAAAAS